MSVKITNIIVPRTARNKRIYTGDSVTNNTVSSSGSPTISDDTVQALSGLTPTWDVSNGIHATLTLSGNTAITLSNLVAGMSGNLTITNPTAVYALTFAGYTNKISTAVFLAENQVKVSGSSKLDVFSWYFDGAYIFINGTDSYN